jgi:DNA polymerase-2
VPDDEVILDSYADPARREMVTWIGGGGGPARAVRTPFTAAFYVAGPRRELSRLAGALALVPGVGAPSFETRTLGLAFGQRRVLKVPMPDPRRLLPVAQMVDARGEHRDFDLYDVDLRMSQRFFFPRGLFPFARVRVAGTDLALVEGEDAWSLDYAPPDLREARLSVAVRSEGPVPSPDDPVASVDVEGVTLEGREEDVLRDAAARLASLDPDVVYTRGGDRWMLRHLASRAKALGLEGWKLGRDAGLLPAKREKSFFQYGKIKYRAQSQPLPGRIHVDLDESFFFSETDLSGVVDMARISGIPLQEIARLEAGTAVTAIQIDQAKREGRLIPWKKNLPEKPKTLRSLVKADRGGYIYDPVVGLHEDIIELDFASLYPSLIARHNLGSEAILCSCCDPDKLSEESFVPQTGYHVCETPALVPRVLDRLVKRREGLKKKRREDPARREEYQGRVDALKWLNVVSFGYQGYRNARFGCIEAHEATCAWGREVLLTAAEVAREHGYDTLHGIVDSLWLRRMTPYASPPEALAAAVQRATRIRFDPVGRYDWIVFLPTRAHRAQGAREIGAPNRFYGCFDVAPEAPSRSQMGQDVDVLAGGRLKVRGVELRQGSAPGVVVKAQEELLDEMAKARTAQEVREAVPRGLAKAARVLKRVRAGACRRDELLISLRVAQELDEYRVAGHVHAALKQLHRRGIRVAPGDRVQVVVTDAQSRDPETRVRELRLWKGDEQYDRAAYETLLLRSLASILLPLGYDEARLAEEMRPGPRQTRLSLSAA